MQERTIFLKVLELKTPEARAAFLDEQCAQDPALRLRIEALLKAHEQSGGVVDALLGADEPTSSMYSMRGDAPPQPAVDPEDLNFLGPSSTPGCLGSLGPYEVIEVIGRGGMGLVFKARDTKLQRIVAIKVLASEIAANKTAKRRFEREAQAAAAVSHDHIVTIHAVDEFNSLPYLVMECIVGRSLQQKLEETGPLELKEILRIGMQAALGLAAAHKQGLVHRDIKPANILLQNGIQRVKITDFGLARATDDVGMTHTGQIAGTPMYMSPEQAQGQRVDHLSDLFSLGSVLYTMCTGRPAFRAPNTVAVLRRVCDDAPRPIREINSDLPVWLADIVGKLMSKEKGERFQTATEVADLLSKRLARLQEPKSSANTCAQPSTPAKQSGESRVRSPEVSRVQAASKQKDEELPELPARSRRIKPIRRVTWWYRLRHASPLTWMVGAVMVPGMIALIVMMALLLNRDQLVVRIELDESLRQQDVMLVLDGTRYAARDLGPSIRVKPGPHVLEVKRGNEQFKSEQFTILQNEKPLFRVKVENGMLSVERADPGTMPIRLADTSPRSVPEPIIETKPVLVAGSKKPLAFETPGFDLWSKNVAAMPVLKQVQAVRDKLVDLNPGFDGNVTPAYENDVVTGLEFLTDNVTDISPVRALVGLRGLQCAGHWRNTVFQDLSPLKDMPLTELDITGTRVSELSPIKDLKLSVLKCGYTQVSNLSPLRNMTLTHLQCWHTPVSDLSPLNPARLATLEINGLAVPDLTALKGFKLKSLSFTATKIFDLTPLQNMPLEGLDCAITPVSDLSPLKSMKLKYLNCGSTQVSSLLPLKDSELTSLICADTQVSDLSPLKDKKLTSLYCGNTPVSDLTPLRGMPLNEIHCQGTRVTDFAPLKESPLRQLSLDFKPERDSELIRSLKNLQSINNKSTAEFWKDVEEQR